MQCQPLEVTSEKTDPAFQVSKALQTLCLKRQPLLVSVYPEQWSGHSAAAFSAHGPTRLKSRSWPGPWLVSGS